MIPTSESVKPRMLYDGDCRFCSKWIERWRVATGDRIDYVRAQDVRRQYPEISDEEFENSVQFIDADGRRSQRAEAVFRAMAPGGWPGRFLLWCYKTVPGFGVACDGGYRVVARHRGIFSGLTTLLWGEDVRPPTFAVSTWLFLRLLGMVYLIAFASFWVQADGLVGSRGILPVDRFFPAVRDAVGTEGFRLAPSLLWIAPSDLMLSGLAIAGMVFAGLLIVGVAQPLVLIGLWASYLSLVVGGQVFYSFQWDNLLLEAGFLSIFLAPWRLRPGLRCGTPHPAARFLLVWLLFRVMVGAGVVKLSSGDPVWADFTALGFHWFTQPLPNPVAWYLNGLPDVLQKLGCAGMFGVELLLPLLMFAPRHLRMFAFAGIAGLQVAIELSGNYGFFNLLTAAIALLLVDDAVWGRGLRIALGNRKRACGLPGMVMVPAAAALWILSLVPFSSGFRVPFPGGLQPVRHVYEWVAPFRTINPYGLFAVMTRERPEILVQGSNDGVSWEEYAFRYKPGALDRRPPFVAPYMPRLDWQMWFAALGNVNQNPWFVEFLRAVLEGRPEVMALLETEPFGGEPPRFVRALVDDYRFATADERRESGDWWVAEPRAIYVPEITIDAFPK